MAKPLIIAGPSGVGKSSLIHLLLNEFPHQYRLSVSNTTRQIREGERDGISYHYISKDEFQQEIDAGNMIEHNLVHGNFYGTSFAELQKDEKICLLDVDVQGIKDIKEKIEAFAMFILPPSIEELQRRLEGRGTETPETVKTRVQNASDEIDFAHEHKLADDIVYNHVLDDAFEELKFKLKTNGFPLQASP